MSDAFDPWKANLCDRILIVGFPLTGKSSFAEHYFGYENLIRTDDYIDSGWELALGRLMRLAIQREKWVIEGVQGFRLLRRMLTLGDPLPELVVYMDPVRDPEPRHEGMRKGLQKIWDECLAMNGSRNGSAVPVQLATERMIPR